MHGFNKSEPGGNRTLNPQIKSLLLCQLSYRFAPKIRTLGFTANKKAGIFYKRFIFLFKCLKRIDIVAAK